ncbi:hypothetical protein [Kribbella sp. NPDC051770]|uniref:hypothetical protein n=1 Tax=Kribbella sp. NPDC051770 TaxID=3155413 RepID=UPI00341C1171
MRPLKWRHFWDELQRCGRPGWPQLIRIPASYLPRGRHLNTQTVLALLAEAGPDRTFDDLIELEPDPDGGFRRGPVEEVGAAIIANAPAGDEGHRQFVFIDADRIRR